MVRPPLMSGSYAQGPYGPFLHSPDMVSVASWNPYEQPVSPITQATAGSSSVFGVTPLSPSAPAYTRSYQPVIPVVVSSSSIHQEQPFPERPGQPECQYYMKTGACKYGSSCRYHHPKEVPAPKVDVVLNPLGLQSLWRIISLCPFPARTVVVGGDITVTKVKFLREDNEKDNEGDDGGEEEIIKTPQYCDFLWEFRGL
ncbi:Zinc finger CCCH domain-containing protein 34 [Hibiscus syriacus]|uniref:Zinc finger CCCH domain-containing protein 34 n=1 Tax=Hibiscus syriacus TaxID=106335 RepID=A0A6A2ZY22_HIBSY|nr:Zinc finger CCCH domain-containing protein 34 [Hibiscus syriacus]